MSLFRKVSKKLKKAVKRLKKKIVPAVTGLLTGGPVGLVGGLIGGGEPETEMEAAVQKTALSTAQPVLPTSQSPLMRTPYRDTYAGLGGELVTAYDPGLEGALAGEPFPGAWAPAPAPSGYTPLGAAPALTAGDLGSLCAGAGVMALAADTPQKSALGQGLLGAVSNVAEMFRAAAAKVVNAIWAQIKAAWQAAGQSLEAMLAGLRQLAGKVLQLLKDALPYAGIAAAVAAVGLGIYFGWGHIKAWGLALWRKFFGGRRRRRRRGISYAELRTAQRVGRAIKKMYNTLPRRPSAARASSRRR